MCNAICVGTQTSKGPTRVTLLFIFYFVKAVQRSDHRTAKEADKGKRNLCVFYGGNAFDMCILIFIQY